MIELQCHCSII